MTDRFEAAALCVRLSSPNPAIVESPARALHDSAFDLNQSITRSQQRLRDARQRRNSVGGAFELLDHINAALGLHRGGDRVAHRVDRVAVQLVLSAGMEAHLAKPFTQNQLRKVLVAWL